MVLTYSKEHYVDIYIFNFVDIIWRHKIFVKKIFLQKIFLPCWQTIAKTVAELTQEVVSDLARKGYSTRNVTVKIRYQDFHTITRACSSGESLRKEGRENSIFYATCRRWMHGPYENDRETSEASISIQCP